MMVYNFDIVTSVHLASILCYVALEPSSNFNLKKKKNTFTLYISTDKDLIGKNKK